MKKKIALILSALCLIALAMGLMAGCGDDKPNVNKEEIIGTYIGESSDGVEHRYFYADIKKSKQYDNGNFYDISVNVVYANGNSSKLTSGLLSYNSENIYKYEGDFSPLPHFGDTWKYKYTFEIENKDKIVVKGEEYRESVKINATYTFERTTLTLEQYVEQRKTTQE